MINLTGALDESVQEKSGHSVYWDLLKKIEKVVVWIMHDFPVPNP